MNAFSPKTSQSAHHTCSYWMFSMGFLSTESPLIIKQDNCLKSRLQITEATKKFTSFKWVLCLSTLTILTEAKSSKSTWIWKIRRLNSSDTSKTTITLPIYRLIQFWQPVLVSTWTKFLPLIKSIWSISETQPKHYFLWFQTSNKFKFFLLTLTLAP
jgi:hypothetical protein